VLVGLGLGVGLVLEGRQMEWQLRWQLLLEGEGGRDTDTTTPTMMVVHAMSMPLASCPRRRPLSLCLGVWSGLVGGVGLFIIGRSPATICEGEPWMSGTEMARRAVLMVEGEEPLGGCYCSALWYVRLCV